VVGGGGAAREGERVAEGIIAKAAKDWMRDAESVGGRALADSAEDGGRAAVRDTTTDVGKVFDNDHVGPLGTGNPANTFTDNRYFVGELEHDQVFFRAGDSAAARGDPALGQFWTSTAPESVSSVREDLAVLPEWPGGTSSPLNTGYAVTMPKGTRYYYGEVGPQAYQGVDLPGGGMQYYIEKPWDLYPPPRKLYEYPLPP